MFIENNTSEKSATLIKKNCFKNNSFNLRTMRDLSD
jgi:hypothetical protein